MMNKFNRRHFMAGTGALMGSSLLSAPNISFAGGHLAAQELRTVGLSVTVQERILNDFKASSAMLTFNCLVAISESRFFSEIERVV